MGWHCCSRKDTLLNRTNFQTDFVRDHRGRSQSSCLTAFWSISPNSCWEPLAFHWCSPRTPCHDFKSTFGQTEHTSNFGNLGELLLGKGRSDPNPSERHGWSWQWRVREGEGMKRNTTFHMYNVLWSSSAWQEHVPELKPCSKPSQGVILVRKSKCTNEVTWIPDHTRRPSGLTGHWIRICKQMLVHMYVFKYVQYQCCVIVYDTPSIRLYATPWENSNLHSSSIQRSFHLSIRAMHGRSTSDALKKSNIKAHVDWSLRPNLPSAGYLLHSLIVIASHSSAFWAFQVFPKRQSFE